MDVRAPAPAQALPAPVAPPTPLGPRQQAFWMVQELAGGTGVANLSLAVRVPAPLRWWPLDGAANHLVRRHPALRTRFPVVDGLPVRHVSAADDVRIGVDVAAATPDDLTRLLAETAARPFDLATELPVRVTQFVIEGGGCALLLVVHHIVADASSLALLMDELAAVYDGIAAGGIPVELQAEVPAEPDPVPEPADLAYWSEHLRGYDAARAVLPATRPEPDRPTFAGVTTGVAPHPGTAAAVTALARSLRTTENLVWLAAWYLALHRHGAGTDLVVGVPVDRRGGAAVASVGFRVSTLPLRVLVDPAAGFAVLARQVRDAFLSGVTHASVSTEDVLAADGHRNGDWRVPLFRQLYNYRPADQREVVIGGVRAEPVAALRSHTQLDLALVVLAGDTTELVTTHSTDVLDGGDVAVLVQRMQALVTAAAADPQRPVAELDMATADERRVIDASNATARPGPDRTVLAAFDAHVAATPDAVAVVEDGRLCHYAELADAAARAAAGLRAAGVGHGDVVGLALPRGTALAAAVLGTWRVGAAYLPLDVDQPAGRTAAALGHAGARALVVAPGSSAVDPGVPVLDWSQIAASESGAAPAGPGLDALAYVIFTSGSTGRPHGVAVEHGSLANLVADIAERVGPVGAVLWSTTPAFDISALELVLPLSTGGTLVVAGPDIAARPDALLDLAVAHDVDLLQATPTFWRLAVVAEPGDRLRGRTVLCGGEPLPPPLAADLLATGCRLLNVYGPTETTIWSTVAEITDAAEPVSIGRPLANTTAFVADDHGAELAPGLLGELCIAGAGVARGYVGLPELTAERFVDRPGRPRYYRTGDLARWRPDGALELFGRTDRQVKLRGHRIELPEIEAHLRAHPDVIDAAVVVVGDPQADAELRAFVVAVDGRAGGLPERLWSYLRELLPTGALPSRTTALAQLPVNANGKRDHAALASLTPVDAPAAAAPEPGDTELAATLLTLWRSALARPRAGADDHFFLHGGHSLLAIRLAADITAAAGTNVPVRMIFEFPTVRRLAARLGRP